MRRLLIFIFISIFFILRPYALEETGLRYSGDDDSYFAHATSIVFGQFPSYKNEYLSYEATSPMHSVGPGLMASPFVFIFSFVDRFLGSDVVVHRTFDNTVESWTLFGFVIATIFYFILGCLLLFKALRLYFPENTASWSVIFLVLFQGLPLFAFRRPIFSQTYEFFLQVVFVFLFLQILKNGLPVKYKTLSSLGIGIGVGLIYLVRYNNIFCALAWPLILFRGYWKKNRAEYFKNIFLAYLAATFLVLIFKIYPDNVNQYQGYEFVGGFLLKLESISFYLWQTFRLFFGVDWGLVYTNPFSVLAIFYFLFFQRYLKVEIGWIMLSLLINFYIVLVWPDQGGWYGYRYLFALLIPTAAFSFASFFDAGVKKLGSKFLGLCFIVALLPLLSMLCFEGNNSNLTLKSVEQEIYEHAWMHPTYQLEVWKTVVFEPLKATVAMLKGGVVYTIILLGDLFHLRGVLPNEIVEKYPRFNPVLFIRVAIIFILPMLVFFIFNRKIPTRGAK